ncbi:MAG: hypothetical protein PHP22_09765 [Oscillospiraceae bacterium]|nr:hypothetical protein [Oscillospiraceae bacterium]
MNSFILTVGGNEYPLKMMSRLKVEAEKKLGQSILKALIRIDETQVFVILLWAALQQYNHGTSLDDVYDIIDTMENEGCKFTDPSSMKEHVCEPFTVSDREKLVMAILKVSGFFTKAEIEAIDEAEAELTKIQEKPRKSKKSSTPPQP